MDYRIKPHVPPLEQIPANSVKFLPCDITTHAEYLTLIINIHFLQYKLLGSQILFALYTFVIQLYLKCELLSYSDIY